MRGKLQALSPYLRHPGRIWKNVRWRLTRRTSPERHVFVVGAPRSGTTLMQVILAAHERLGSFQGESGLFTWQDLFDRSRRHMNLEAQRLEALFEECSDVVEFFDCASQVKKKQSAAARFVEKTPQHVLKLSFIHRHFPKAQFVHLYRDGRDCYCSARDAGIPRADRLEAFARYWRRCIRGRQQQGDDARVLDVSYETLTREPEATVRCVMEFLGERFAPEQIEPQARSQDKRSDEQQFLRLSSEINTQSQGRWKEELSAEEVSTFASIAGDELQRLGYEV